MVESSFGNCCSNRNVDHNNYVTRTLIVYISQSNLLNMHIQIKRTGATKEKKHSGNIQVQWGMCPLNFNPSKIEYFPTHPTLKS